MSSYSCRHPGKSHLGVVISVELACQRLQRTAVVCAQLGPTEQSWQGRRGPYLAKRYALPYHPTSGKEWKSLVIRGIACTKCQLTLEAREVALQGLLTVVIMERSSITRKNTKVKETKTMANLKRVTYWWSCWPCPWLLTLSRGSAAVSELCLCGFSPSVLGWPSSTETLVDLGGSSIFL